MRVLVACEESQRVCIAFRERGHEAYSCDIKECSGGHPEWHIQGDCLRLFNGGGYTFKTMDGTQHNVPEWDLLIAHPPCTYLSNAGAVRLFPKGVLNQDRYQKGLQGKEFFLKCLNAECKRIAVENPVPTRIYDLPPYTQTIQPYEFGEPYIKKTCLWLKGLPPLKPTNVLCKDVCISWVKGGSKDKYGRQRKRAGTTYKDSRTRSKTFEGIAKAMAQQWSF